MFLLNAGTRDQKFDKSARQPWYNPADRALAPGVLFSRNVQTEEDPPVSPKSFLHTLKVMITVATLTVVFVPVLGAAPKEKVLHVFDGSNGAQPMSTLTSDKAGNLYGTTWGAHANNSLCGSAGCGIVFELTPTSNGGWTSKVLHAFTGGSDGGIPQGTLVLDDAGNVYGTTYRGGSRGMGVVFELSPHSGRWKETVLHAFAGSPDGAGPTSGVIFDAVGDLYGTTSAGGNASGGGGTVFTLTHTSRGWTEALLHSFPFGCGKASCSDGASPNGLVFGAKATIFGTTSEGGVSNCTDNEGDLIGCGVVYELMLSDNGWTESVIYTFTGAADGGFPVDALVIDSAYLHFYGTSQLGGGCNGSCGNVFEISHSDGQWVETVIHNFDGKDGSTPKAGLTIDPAGNLFGTTSSGTRCCSDLPKPPKRGPCCGTVFELTPDNDAWKETVLHNFTGGDDGMTPEGGVVFDAAGNLYGTTAGGGARGEGVVFEIKP